jgi:arylsulfatase A-like enzyme
MPRPRSLRGTAAVLALVLVVVLSGSSEAVAHKAPSISSFSPTSGPVGTSVTISGSSLGSPTSVTFNGHGASILSSTSSSISTVVPQAATSGRIAVTTRFGTGTSQSNFTVTAPSTPNISSFSPTSGPVGTGVTISGTNLASAQNVKFNGTSAPILSNTQTVITTTVPSGATSGRISVTTAGGTDTSQHGFTVTLPPAPTISSFSPTSGPIGTNVTINGSNLGSAQSVKFNGTSASILSNTQSMISTSVPSGATSGRITVTTAGGTATSSSNFTVSPPPAISDFSPASGPIGTGVTINGSNLGSALSVKFNGQTASILSNTQTVITTIVPQGAMTGPITVTTANGTATSSSDFTVTSITPTISNFTPASGSPGTGVTINGSNLGNAQSVKFNGTSASILTNTPSAITTSVPLGASTGPISVTTANGTATSSTNFTVIPPNIVLILTDDQRYDQLANMPTVQSQLVDKGVSFSNSFVVNPLCCPSRATILTGQYSHGTQVYDNQPPFGGFPTFRKTGDDQSTIATWLHADGYHTGLVGKYLTGYTPKWAPYIPPGWDTWNALSYGSGPNGPANGLYYNYYMSIDGALSYYGTSDADYSTDVLASDATRFIQNAPANQPLFLDFAPRAPHLRAKPPTRYKTAFPGATSPRPPSYNEADVSDKPAYIQAQPQLSPTDQTKRDNLWRAQLQSLLAVDDAVNGILTALQDTGRLNNTLIMFASDNGLQFGEHRWLGKKVPYEESIRVPLIIRYDPITQQTASKDSAFALNLDYAPTFADLAGVPAPNVEGTSLMPLLTGTTPQGWRTDFLIEHEDTSNIEVPAYCAVRNQQYIYVDYLTGEEELYDVQADPFELNNLASNSAYATIKNTMHQRLVQLCTPPPPGYTP